MTFSALRAHSVTRPLHLHPHRWLQLLLDHEWNPKLHPPTGPSRTALSSWSWPPRCTSGPATQVGAQVACVPDGMLGGQRASELASCRATGLAISESRLSCLEQFGFWAWSYRCRGADRRRLRSQAILPCPGPGANVSEMPYRAMCPGPCARAAAPHRSLTPSTCVPPLPPWSPGLTSYSRDEIAEQLAAAPDGAGLAAPLAALWRTRSSEQTDVAALAAAVAKDDGAAVAALLQAKPSGCAGCGWAPGCSLGGGLPGYRHAMCGDAGGRGRGSGGTDVCCAGELTC